MFVLPVTVFLINTPRVMVLLVKLVVKPCQTVLRAQRIMFVPRVEMVKHFQVIKLNAKIQLVLYPIVLHVHLLLLALPVEAERFPPVEVLLV